jgi:redox-sensitive bicupin YhaK (pirin superfamily)
MTTDIVRRDQHYHVEAGWLSTYWHFSFDRYFDPENVSFGPLRVFNDDTVKPGGGWGMHPHRDMEIVTYVVRGRLEHEDSSGSRAVIEAGGVQHMTAGRGIWHSERNPSDEESLRLLQMWIMPAERGLPPSHEARQFSKTEMEDVLLPVVSKKRGNALGIHQDVTIFASRLTTGGDVSHDIKRGRRGYLFVIEGTVQFRDQVLQEEDVVRIVGREVLDVKALGPSELIVLDLPMD